MASKEPAKRKAVYNPEADKRWREANRDRVNYQSSRRSARSFIRRASLEDLDELEQMINDRRKTLTEE